MKGGKKLIMIADDEPEIIDVLKLLLTGDGYAVLTVKDGLSVLEHILPEIDLYILDINMRGLSGIMAGSKIREKYDTPIIFLTAYSSESDKVMGFAAGTDDYIVKPFSNIELLMRVKAILRRSNSISSQQQSSGNKIILQDLVLDMDSQSVFKGDETINLTFTEYKILELLASHKKKIYSLENIYQSVWGNDAIGDSAIMVHIKNIRKKLGDNSRNFLTFSILQKV